MKKIFLILLTLFPLIISAQMTEREQQVLDEINLVRTNPKAYIVYIDEYLKVMDSDAAERASANELKRELKKMKPVNALVFSEDLYKSCKAHGDYVIKTKKFVHSKGNYGENIQYGQSEIRYAVIDLLIDHGIPTRGHRENILNPKYKYFAVYEIPQKVGKMQYFFIQQFDY
ncbi:MAG: CAP domain-containing protein [Candidatus Gastranaerophilales bacterium]|nr:CAP domain-containing protein [Candidatus Gastranaerophilales bacterium]